MAPRWSRRIDPAIEDAIREGAKAGVFWRAARYNPKSAKTWEAFAQLHSDRARELLEIMVKHTADPPR